MSPPNEAPGGRPLSPHLQIYKPQITSMLSILNRITGGALALGFLVFVSWLVALASGPEGYGNFLTCAQSFLGQLVLFGFSLAFFFHFCLGIRHLIWDAGYYLELPEVYKSGRIAVIAALVLTLLVWLKVYGVAL